MTVFFGLFIPHPDDIDLDADLTGKAFHNMIFCCSLFLFRLLLLLLLVTRFVVWKRIERRGAVFGGEATEWRR